MLNAARVVIVALGSGFFALLSPGMTVRLNAAKHVFLRRTQRDRGTAKELTPAHAVLAPAVGSTDPAGA